MSDPQRHLDLAIVIVSYNVRDLLRRCLVSIDEASRRSDLRLHTIVIDNASSDGSAAMIRDEFRRVALIALDRNAGFAAGNNAGLQRVLGGESPPDQSGTAVTNDLLPARYVLLLNPDTEIVGDALGVLVRYLDDHADVVVVGPQLRYSDGSIQQSRRRFPTIGTLFWESTLLDQWWPGNPWARRYRCDDRPADQAQRVDWLVGAALLARTDVIRQAGLLDEGFFMYSEELEWQSRLGTHGAIMFVPDALVVHYEGKSSEQNLARRHINFNRSKLRYARMRWGRPIAVLLRLFLLATFMLQLAIEAAKWAIGHKRSLRRARIGQYARVLRSGL